MNNELERRDSQRICLEELKEGDVVAEHVTDENNNILFRRGITLDLSKISALSKRGISEVEVVVENTIDGGGAHLDAHGNAIVVGGINAKTPSTIGKINSQDAIVRIRHMMERLQMGFARHGDNPTMDRAHQDVLDYLGQKIASLYE